MDFIYFVYFRLFRSDRNKNEQKRSKDEEIQSKSTMKRAGKPATVVSTFSFAHEFCYEYFFQSAPRNVGTVGGENQPPQAGSSKGIDTEGHGQLRRSARHLKRPAAQTATPPPPPRPAKKQRTMQTSVSQHRHR